MVRRGLHLIPTFLKKNTEIPESGNAAGDLAGPLPDYGRAGDLAGFSSALGAFIMGSILAGTVQAESIEKVIAPVRGRPVRGGLLRVGRDAGRAGDAGAIHRADRFLTVVVIVGQIFYGTLGFPCRQNLKIALQSSFSLAQIGELPPYHHRVARTVDGGNSSFLYPVAVAVSVVTTFTTPFIIRLSDPAYHRINRLIPKRMKALLARYSAGSQTVNSEREWMSLLKKVAVEHVYLLRAVGRRGVDLFELLFAVRRGAFRRIRRQTDRYDDDHSLY